MSTEISLLPAEKRKLQLQEWHRYDRAECAKEGSGSIKRPTSDTTPNSKKRLRFNENAVFLAACQAGDIKEVTGMLSSGQDINCYNNDGLTALHAACIDGNYQMTDFLVRQGANIDAKDHEGWTPLHAAAGSDDIKISTYLVEKRAQVDAINCEGELAIDVTEDASVVTLLEKALKVKGIISEAGKNLKRKQEEQTLLDDAQRLKLMNLPCSIGGFVQDPNPHPRSKATMVHVAASKGYIKALQILIENVKMDIEARDIDEWTPLHAAAHWEEEKSIRLLHKLGANFLALTKFNQMPIDVMFPEEEDGMTQQNDVYKLVQKLTEEARAKKKQQEEEDKKKKEREEREQKAAAARALEMEQQALARSKRVGDPEPSQFEGSLYNRKAKSEVGLERTPSGNKIRALQSLFTDEEVRRKSTAVIVPKRKTENDVKRAISARRERAARRCTQGVMLETVSEAKKLYQDRKGVSDQGPSMTLEPNDSDLKTPTAYIPVFERNQILQAEESSRAVPRTEGVHLAMASKVEPLSPTIPSTPQTDQQEENIRQEQERQFNTRRMNKRKQRKDMTANRQKTGKIVVSPTEDMQPDMSVSGTSSQEVPTNSLLSEITNSPKDTALSPFAADSSLPVQTKLRPSKRSDMDKVMAKQDKSADRKSMYEFDRVQRETASPHPDASIASFNTDQSAAVPNRRTSKKPAAERMGTVSADWKAKYEAERAQKEKSAREIEAINGRLAGILKTVTPKSRAVAGDEKSVHRPISSTVDRLESEIRGQTDELTQLRMENGALIRVISKMRGPGYH